MPKPDEQPNTPEAETPSPAAENPRASKRRVAEVLDRVGAARADAAVQHARGKARAEQVRAAVQTSPAKRRQIEHMIAAMSPEQIERFLQTACDDHFEPGLPLAAFEAFVKKCTPKAVEILRERLQNRKRPDGSTYVSEEGLARLQAILDNDPNRK